MSATSYPPGTVISKPDHQFKILMIGESGVGKSALLSRFVDNQFDTNFISTIGVDFKIHYMKVDQQDIKLQVWDTAGQERFRTITTSYYRGANGIMIVFDVTDTPSFEKVRYWLNELKEHVGPDMPAVLVGNKIDCQRERTVDNATAQRFSQEVNIPYMETSAKTPEGVTEAYALLVTKMLAQSKQKAAFEPSNSNVDVNSSASSGGGGGCGC